jgi:hypothetical protein
MNKNRRMIIERIRSDLSELLCVAEQERDGEQQSFDNIPESFQGGSKGEAAEAAIGSLETIVEGIQQAIDGCDEIN